MNKMHIDFHLPGNKEVRYEMGLVCAKEEVDKGRFEELSKFFPGTSAAKMYNNLLDAANKHFGETGVYLLSLTKPVFELVENLEYKKILKEISTQ